jgi:hypothetical protein
MSCNKAEGGFLAAADGILVNSANEEYVVKKLREAKMVESRLISTNIPKGRRAGKSRFRVK